jgi:hypothetical protein
MIPALPVNATHGSDKEIVFRGSHELTLMMSAKMNPLMFPNYCSTILGNQSFCYR